MTDRLPLKRITRLAYGGALAADIRVEGKYSVVGSGGTSGTHNSRNFRAPGIVIGRKGSYGSIHWVPGGGFAIDTAYFIDETCTSADLRWLYYALQAVDLRGVSQDVGVPGLSRESAYQVLLPAAPALEEQRRIADFLDAEVSRMDRLASLRGKQLALSIELLATHAAEITGRSLLRQDNDASQHSSVQLRRAISAIQTGTTPSGLRDNKAVGSPTEGVPWYTPAAINGLLSVSHADKYVPSGDLGDVPHFPSGSVLVTGIGESLGKIGYLADAATGNQQLTALTPAPGCDGRFLAWQLWAAQEELREWAQYSRIRIINNEVLKSFPIHLPSYEAQVSASDKLDARKAHFTRLREKFDEFSELVAERRRALITAAVTGQIDVSTASGRGIEE
ncbi:restriction endonuclease subunit S [Streptomyces phaeochromogenes]|uniref:restriction endonuclease subunit S n=1 Tax=Streptomyces phaeochromogenes TaxID=1923 RepID=UPI0036B276F2